MNTITKEIKNTNRTKDMVIAKANDDYDIIIHDNYKLIKFSNTKKTFRDTILGSDIGIHSRGFINVAIISSLIAIVAIALMYFSFRI